MHYCTFLQELDTDPGDLLFVYQPLILLINQAIGNEEVSRTLHLYGIYCTGVLFLLHVHMQFIQIARIF
jgi:hypothetical protein